MSKVNKKQATSKTTKTDKSEKNKTKIEEREPLIHQEDLSENEEEDVDDAEDEFFNQNSYDDFTRKYHIEELSTNYKNDDLHKTITIIKPENRITSEIMSHAEYTRIVSERAHQIENGSPIFITLTNEINAIKIAEKEIRQKKCPLKIMRKIHNSIAEEWSVNEMVIPFGINI